MKIVLLALVVCFALSLEEMQYRFLFEEFRAEYNKVYSDAREALMRYDIFKHNYDFIRDYNSKHTFELEINMFGDLTNEEFTYYVTRGYSPKNEQKFEIATFDDANDLPVSIDWREKGAVRDVVNQGQCGSCWAFGATASLEAIIAIKRGVQVKLSEQQLVDCVILSSGCNGGLASNALFYASLNDICHANQYGYVARQGDCRSEKCDVSKKMAEKRIDSVNDLTPYDMGALHKAAAQQVVSVSVQANEHVFQFYRKGIIDADCHDSVNHAVAAVGYGVEDGKKYWILKNSWGPNWGDKGYLRILREDGFKAGMCGIATRPSIPVIKS